MSPQRQLEPFLRQATRGLWGEKRRLVRAELLGHLSLRIDELLLEGLSPEQAARRALEELGHPAAISAGMRQVYVLPRLWPLLALLALTLSLLTLWPKPSGFVSAVPWQVDTPGVVRPTLIGLPEVQAELIRQGVGLERVRIWSVGMVGLEFEEGELFARVVLQDDREYLLLDDLVTSALQLGLSFRLRGWRQPVLEVGRVRLRLGGQVNPASAYASLARWAVLGGGGASLFRAENRCVHLVPVGDAPGTVYALLVPPAPETAGPALESRVASIAPVEGDGLVRLRSSEPALRLGAGQAQLIRLSGAVQDGQVEHKAVQPAQVRDLGCLK